MVQPLALPINSFGIHGLFGKFDLSLPLKRMPLILVGPNGTGKSTVLSILNLFLTGQWPELVKYPFGALILETGGDTVEILKEDIQTIHAIRSALGNIGLRRAGGALPSDFDEIERFLRLRSTSFGNLGMGNLKERYPQLRRIADFIEIVTRPSVMYYPTYRRIERELDQLVDLSDFSGFEIDLSAGIRRRFEQYGEVIGFGGQDVQGLIDRATLDIETSARRALNEHSVKFLELLYQAGKLSTANFRAVISDSNRVDKLIERINTLSPDAINTSALRQSIGGIQEKLRKGGAGRLSAKEDVAIFYVAQLIQVFQRIDGLTRPLQEFCRLTDDYLRPFKRAVFNESTFKVNLAGLNDQPVSLDDFSSGEKQVLSIFAFLIFSREPRGQFLIIDEPELSLSVVWQKRLLLDIIGTHRPKMFVTATHSPFIFDDISLDHTISMEELLR